MLKYAQNKPNATQTEQARPDQVQNDAGGYVFKLDPFDMLKRFLVLGAEGGTYYASEQKHVERNVKCIDECLKQDAKKTVEIIVEISESGRAPKNEPAIYALAKAFAFVVESGKTSQGQYQQALLADALPKVARIGTDLLHFVQYVKGMRGMGRGLRKAIAQWYALKSPKDVAFQVTKYAQRDGMSHRDVFRLVHPAAIQTPLGERSEVYKHIVGKSTPTGLLAQTADEAVAYLWATEAVKKAEGDHLLALIDKYKLPMEVIPTDKRSAKVYEAMMQTAGLGWLVRNLGNLGKHGVLTETSWDTVKVIEERLGSQHALGKARLHPVKIMAALLTYKNGRGVKGSGEWKVNQRVCEALEKAFYLSFKNIEPAGKRFMLGVDVSGSMGGGAIAGVPGFTPAIGAGLMAMTTYRTEPKTLIKGFCNTLVDLPIGPNSSLEDVLKWFRLPFGSTDCSKPIVEAARAGQEFDAFVIYTDNETYAGNVHPYKALQDYRRKTGIDAKLIVVGMTATGFTIADPNDKGMLDVVGFDTATPELISAFAAGRV